MSLAPADPVERPRAHALDQSPGLECTEQLHGLSRVDTHPVGQVLYGAGPAFEQGQDVVGRGIAFSCAVFEVALPAPTGSSTVCHMSVTPSSAHWDPTFTSADNPERALTKIRSLRANDYMLWSADKA